MNLNSEPIDYEELVLDLDEYQAELDAEYSERNPTAQPIGDNFGKFIKRNG